MQYEFQSEPQNVIYLNHYFIKLKANKPSERKVVLNKNPRYHYCFYYYNCNSVDSFPAKIDLIDKSDSIIATLDFSNSKTGNVEFTVPKSDEYIIKAISGRNIHLYFRLGMSF